MLYCMYSLHISMLHIFPHSQSSAHYESIIKVMEEERELYQKELELLKLHRCPSMTNLKVTVVL